MHYPTTKRVLFAVSIAVLPIITLAAWTPPSGTPPANNASEPINVSATDQFKQGVFGAKALNIFGTSQYLSFGNTVGLTAPGLRFNTTANKLEFSNGDGTWTSLDSAGSGTVTNVIEPPETIITSRVTSGYVNQWKYGPVASCPTGTSVHNWGVRMVHATDTTGAWWYCSNVSDAPTSSIQARTHTQIVNDNAVCEIWASCRGPASGASPTGGSFTTTVYTNTTTGGSSRTYTCPAGQFVLSANEILSPAGSSTCIPGISADKTTVTYGFCNVVSGQSWNLKVICGGGGSSGGLSQWTTAGSNIYYNSGSVGVGNTNPEETLHVSGNILQDNGKVLSAKNATGTAEYWMWPRWTDNTMYTNFGLNGWNIRNNASTPVMFMSNSGSVGIGTINPNTSALLDVDSTSKGVLMPRMTSTQRDAITTPVAGLMVYNTTTGTMNYFNGSSWVSLGSGGKGLSIAGTTYATTYAPFTVSNVYTNTLLPASPTTSDVTIPEAGSYYITTSQSTCVSGSNQYATTRILINGSQVAYGVSDPYECASAAASVFKKLSAGDVISGQCSHNGGSQTSCAMTIVQISSTNTTTGSGTGLGVAQAYVDVTASRAINTNYTNSTGKPIFVIISTVNSNSVSSLWATVDGIMLGYTGCMNGRRCQTSFVVPNGSTYSASWNGSNTLANWVELR